MALSSGNPDIRVKMSPQGLSEVLGALGAVKHATVAMATIGGPVLLIAHTLEAIDAQLKLARTLGASSRGLETLQRAAGLAGVEKEKLAQATSNLDVLLGKALQGEDKATEAFDRLGLSVREISKLDVDQRIEAINNALLRNVPAAERAAVAAEIFGKKMRGVIGLIDADALATAREEVEALGLAVSEVDATTIERARDQFSSLSEAARGAANRIAVALAPVLDDVSQRLRKMAIDSRGFENEIRFALDVAVRFAGLLANAFRGLEIIATGVKLGWQEISVVILEALGSIAPTITRMVNGAIDALNFLIRAFNKIPGIDVIFPIEEINRLIDRDVAGAFERMAETARAGVTETRAELEQLANAPLPSEELKLWLAEVTAASAKASEEVVKARKAMAGGGGEGRGAIDPESQRRLDKLRESLMSEADAERVAHEARLREIKEFQRKKLITQTEFDQLILLEAVKHQENLAKIQEKQDAVWQKVRDQRAADLVNLQDYALVEEELEAVRHQRRLEQLVAAAEETNMKEEEYRRLREDLELKHQAALGDIAAQGGLKMRRIAAMSQSAQFMELGGAFTNMLAAYGAYNDKFARAARIAGATQAFIATMVGAAESLKLGWPMGVIAAFQMLATGFGFIAAIKSGSGGAVGGTASVTPTGQLAEPATQPLGGGNRGTSQTTVVQLIGETFGRKQVRELLERINENNRDGGRLVLA